MPEPDNADATVGEVIKNTGPSTVTLHEVSLVDAESLSTLQAYAIPLAEGDTATGSGTTNPTNAQQKALWETRRKPSSVVLDAGESANVVVVVSLENGKSEGSAAAMKIEYSANDEKYSAESSTELLLRRDRCF